MSRISNSRHLDQIEARLDAATPGPWEAVLGATPDGSQLCTTQEQKTEFLSMSLNDDEAPLWLVIGADVIPAATGDGPKAHANADFIANAPQDVRTLLAAVDAVMLVHAPRIEGSNETYCRSCYVPPYGHAPYPCPTVEALTVALEATK